MTSLTGRRSAPTQLRIFTGKATAGSWVISGCSFTTLMKFSASVRTLLATRAHLTCFRTSSAPPLTSQMPRFRPPLKPDIAWICARPPRLSCWASWARISGCRGSKLPVTRISPRSEATSSAAAAACAGVCEVVAFGVIPPGGKKLAGDAARPGVLSGVGGRGPSGTAAETLQLTTWPSPYLPDGVENAVGGIWKPKGVAPLQSVAAKPSLAM
mmetsp:Transcript_105686/g.252067  ORF Transcript_105686/g.252067 Transcript_105686/m.252067 type:complete len:213 (-) Transcript_105686:882-1520(-)